MSAARPPFALSDAAWKRAVAADAASRQRAQASAERRAESVLRLERTYGRLTESGGRVARRPSRTGQNPRPAPPTLARSIARGLCASPAIDAA